MAVNQYIGARYVPVFADPLEWSSANTYEPLMIVMHGGDTYTSKQFVPSGIDIDDTRFWVRTADYNAQIAEYRETVKTYDSRISAVETKASKAVEDITAESAVRKNADAQLESKIEAESSERQSEVDTLTNNLSSESSARESAVTTLTNNLNAEIAGRQGADSSLSTKLETETNARTSADSALSSQITTVNGNLTTETNARTSADNALSTRIAALSNITSGNGTVTDQVASGSTCKWVRVGNVCTLDMYLNPKYDQSSWDTSPAFVSGLPKAAASSQQYCGVALADNGNIGLWSIDGSYLKLTRRSATLSANVPLSGSAVYICE